MSSFTAKAPARANLIGEHTDYATNGGHVLPTPLPFYTTATVTEEAGPAGQVTLTSGRFPDEKIVLTLADLPREGWTDYVMGSVKAVAEKAKLPALSIHIESEVPFGSGISSSAALCVSVIRSLKGLYGLTLSDEEIALMAHVAEHDFVGVPCGKMDQFASSVGRPGQALLLNTKTLAYQQYPLPPDEVVMLVDCGKKHDLAKGGGYRQRVAECTAARDLLGVETLCQLTEADLPKVEAIADPLIRKRARHVVTENLRVLAFVKALEAGDVKTQAALIAQSHVSQRDDFEVTIPEIDALVESSNRFCVNGARICGGGFGGSIIALVPKDQTDDWWAFVSKENPQGRLISTYGLKKAQ
ncbi:MAG: galactokinase [Rhizomicrobium sp.]